MDFFPCNIGDLLSKSQNRNNIELVKSLFLQCCQAIKYLHDNNMKHKNIHPGNILIDQKFNAYLCDIKLSKERFGHSKPMVGAQLHFISPDELNCMYHYSTDIWSLAASFYKFLKGFAPYYSRQKINMLTIFQNKVHCTHYEELNLSECDSVTLIEIINNA